MRPYCGVLAVWGGFLLAATAAAFDAEEVAPGLTQWSPIGRPGHVQLNCLTVHAGDIWVGTSLGDLWHRSQSSWRRPLKLERTQITGIAFEPASNTKYLQHGKRLWLSTSDGIRRFQGKADRPDQAVDQPGQGAATTSAADAESSAGNSLPLLGFEEADIYRTHYQGHPAFVSGAYMPGRDAVRQWGYVESIYVPRQIRTYAPFVISNAHGLFCWGGYGGVWHHFMPHYGGPNTAWLDTRELLPLRRPTCIVEDQTAGLWLGSEGDGIVLMKPEARKQDVGEDKQQMWTRFGPGEVGCPFDTVVTAHAGEEIVWFGLQARDKRRWIAAVDPEHRWRTWELPKVERRSQRNGKVIKTVWWEADPVALLQRQDGTVWVGVTNQPRTGVLKLDPDSGEFTAVAHLERPIHQFVTLGDEIWMLARDAIYQQRGEHEQ